MMSVNDTFTFGGPAHFEFPKYSAEELSSKEDEIRLLPEVITEALMTMIHRYKQEGLAELREMTPFVKVNVGNDGDRVIEVCAGGGPSDKVPQAVFIKDSETGQAVDFIRFGYNYYTAECPIAIADGYSLRTIESMDELLFVRNLIDGMNRAYHDRAVSEANLALLRLLEQEVNAIPAHIAFRVRIVGDCVLWGDEDVNEVIVTDSLPGAISRAIDKFKKINHMDSAWSTNQYVGLLVNQKPELEVPSEVYKPLFQALSQRDSEAELVQKLMSEA